MSMGPELLTWWRDTRCFIAFVAGNAGMGMSMGGRSSRGGLGSGRGPGWGPSPGRQILRSLRQLVPPTSLTLIAEPVCLP